MDGRSVKGTLGSDEGGRRRSLQSLVRNQGMKIRTQSGNPFYSALMCGDRARSGRRCAEGKKGLFPDLSAQGREKNPEGLIRPRELSAEIARASFGEMDDTCGLA